MKVLLINPPALNIVQVEIPSVVRGNEGFFPPLGLMYIASYLKENSNCDIKIIDAVADKMTHEQLYQSVLKYNPDVVGIISHTHNLVDVCIVAKNCKRINDKILVCLGGPHVNVYPKESISFDYVDFVVLGEGERTFTELIKVIESKGNYCDVKGLIFKKDGNIVETDERLDISNLDEIPFPLRSLIDSDKYYSILGKNKVMTTLISSRGCPYRCSFCSTPKGKYRMRSPGNIVDEIEECVRSGINEVHFVDDTFNLSTDRVNDICDEIIRRGLKIDWSFRGHIDKITKQLLLRVKQAGCCRIQLGVETSTDEGLQVLNKGINIEQIKKVFCWAKEVKIATVAYFMIGCPHEKTKEDIYRTIKFAVDLNADYALFNILTLYPHTDLYKKGISSGILSCDCWGNYVKNPDKDFQPPTWSENFSRKELKGYLNIAYRQFYLRPHFIIKAFCSVNNWKMLINRVKTGCEFLRLK